MAKDPADNEKMARTVLIVEDLDQSASMLEIALAPIPGIEIVHARSGQQALQLLDSRDPRAFACLVTDLHMPGVDGFELIERVRSNPRCQRLPIVVLSGDTDPATPNRIARLGADAYFPKPYSPAEVRKKVEDLLNASRS